MSSASASASASAFTSPRNTASSPPRSIISSPTTTTTTSQAHHVVQQQGLPSRQQQQMRQAVPQPSPPSASSSRPAQAIHPTLPSSETQRDIASARNAVVASLSNMVDTELQSRATVLHENASALDKQERDVIAATAGLRREREKLAKEADGAARKIKELGNVQNWAEVLERQFLVLEETVRLANGGKEYKEGDDDASSRSGSYCSCSCSDCGGDEDLEDERDNKMHLDRDGAKDSRREETLHQTGLADHDAAKNDFMAVDGSQEIDWSDTSRSLNEPESSTGTGMAKGSETASISTT